MYVDGHECPDVQKYCTEFLAVISSGECRRTTFDDETLEPIQPILKPGEKKHIPVHHNESIFRSNVAEGLGQGWQDAIEEEGPGEGNSCIRFYY